MNVALLTLRLRKAYASKFKTLRQLSAECNVSHELIRKLLKAKEPPNLQINNYNKINLGLFKNGF